jgi:hypothetical protein
MGMIGRQINGWNSRVIGARGTTMCRYALTIVVAASAAPVAAQTATNPRLIEFVPSAEHSVLLPNGYPAVQGYELGFYLPGGSLPFQTIYLGKPALQADGMVRYDFASQLTGWPLPDVDCEGHVAAYGPDGKSSGAVSNRFLYTAAFWAPVTALNAPPQVTLTTPFDGSVYGSGTSITLSAAASDGDGTVSSVEFYVGSARIATSAAAPFATTWTTQAGTYILSAVAVDDRGARTTSNVAKITVRHKKKISR